MYQNVLEGTPCDVEAEFALWRTKCISGTTLCFKKKFTPITFMITM